MHIKKYKVALDFACPVCAASPSEKCELHSGIPRFESHRERLDMAVDALTGLPPKKLMHPVVVKTTTHIQKRIALAAIAPIAKPKPKQKPQASK